MAINVYDLAAASYDAAVRDALPTVTGSQPVLFVFAAGNAGGGDDTMAPAGNADTILSPATAKNVITVGALQELRNITNIVTDADGTIEQHVWQPETGTSYRVAWFSSRGNVGVGHGRRHTDGSSRTWSRRERSSSPPDPSNGTKSAYYNPTNYRLDTCWRPVVSPGSDEFLFAPGADQCRAG